jgi:antitoxin component HigA of HigAB toxin-antitoxin module
VKTREKEMATERHHWTEKSTDDFLYRIGADFVRQIETAMESVGVNQADLARRLKVSEGRVSQVLNNPGNLTLRKVVEYVRALGRKVAIVEYNDGDQQNINGPVNSEIFARCWYEAGKPNDFFALENATTTFVLAPISSPCFMEFSPSRRAANTRLADDRLDHSASTEKTTIVAENSWTGVAVYHHG